LPVICVFDLDVGELVLAQVENDPDVVEIDKADDGNPAAPVRP
jgi:hypothetical protein